MKIIEWLQSVLISIRNFLAQLGVALISPWRSVKSRVIALFQRSSDTEPAVNRRQGSESFLKRILYQGQVKNGILIRKIGVKRHYRYNLISNPQYQLMANIANPLAIVIGLGTWSHSSAWFTQLLPSALVPHEWILSALLGILPIIAVYLRWQFARQHDTQWDILTISTGLISISLALFTWLLMFTIFTHANVSILPLLCASIAMLVWIFGESTNAYAVLIHRPRSLIARLSLGKSLLFILSGWLLLLYSLLVQFRIGEIQPESAEFLYVIFSIAALLGVLMAVAGYVVEHQGLKIPRFKSSMQHVKENS